MYRKDKPLAGSYYHIYNRGVNYQNIFFTRENWSFFLRRLRHYATLEKVIIIAYCLMPNHYHLLVFLITDNFGQEVMQPFMVSYTKAINNQERRVGPLFQGPYKPKRVTSERYLMHLSRYIHLNPVTAGFVDAPEDWPYSSYAEYIGIRNGTLPHPEVVLEQLANSRNPVFRENSSRKNNLSKNRVSDVSEDSNKENNLTKNRVSKVPKMSELHQAYADYVCDGKDERAGLVDSLLID